MVGNVDICSVFANDRTECQKYEIHPHNALIERGIWVRVPTTAKTFFFEYNMKTFE